MPQISSTPDNQNNKAHALLIGVGSYLNFSDSNLSGSRNDVVLLAYYCMSVLGIPAQNIRVLTTPKLSLDEFKTKMIPDLLDGNLSAGLLEKLGQVTLGEASSTAEVQEGLNWLLEASTKSDAAAIFAFSGHGAWSAEDGPLLCLGDTTKDFQDGVLPVKKLGEDIENAKASGKVIALFDCCHVATSRANPKLGAKALPHAGTAEKVLVDQDLFNVSNRVLLGAHPGDEAFQMCLGGTWHGALTFAMVTAAERWRGENGMSHGSYKHVLKRAKLMLEVLHVPQKPEFWVAVRERPFMGVKPGPTTREPDALSSGMQLNPDFLYTIALDSGEVLAKIVATGTGRVFVNDSELALPTSTECWYVSPTALNSLSSSNKLRIIATPLDALGEHISIDSSFSQKFPSDETAHWSRCSLPVGAQVFSGTCPNGTREGAKAYVVLTIPESGNLSLTHVVWYLPEAPSNGTFQFGGDPPGIEYARTTTPPPTTDVGAASL